MSKQLFSTISFLNVVKVAVQFWTQSTSNIEQGSLFGCLIPFAIVRMIVVSFSENSELS